MAASRRSGQRNPAIGQAPGISLIKLTKDLKRFVRRDFGGQDQDRIIANRLQEDGVPVNPDTIAAYRSGALRTKDTIKKYFGPRFDQIRATIGF